MEVLILDVCPFCHQRTGLGRANWTYRKSGRRYDMPIFICYECGKKIGTMKEAELAYLINYIQTDLQIQDLEKETNSHDA
jgi:cytochrome c